jgi:hypothetical protein
MMDLLLRGPLAAKSAAAGSRTLERYNQPFVGGIAVHEVDTLPSNLDAIVASNETMKTRAAENPLGLSSVFQQLPFRADEAPRAVRFLDRHVCNDPAGA